MPDSVTVEVEFTAGTWTDVTAYLDGASGGNTRFGRTSPIGEIGPGTLTLTLDNTDGRFTPARQLLADGTTTHPYYPNVVPRKRIRVAYVISGTPYYRFTGYIKGWPPSMVDGVKKRVTVTASTLDDQLSRVILEHLIVQEHSRIAAAGGKGALYLMNDPLPGGAVRTTFREKNARYGSLYALPTAFVHGSFQTADTPVPVVDGLTGLGTVNGAYVINGSIPGIDGTNFAVSQWLTVPALNVGNSVATTNAWHFDMFDTLNLGAATVAVDIAVAYPSTPSGNVPVTFSVQPLSSTITSSLPNDAQPHHLAVTVTTSGGTQTLAAYIDGSAVGTASFAAGGLTMASFGTGLVQSIQASTDTSYNSLAVVNGPLSIFWGGTYNSATAAAMYGAGVGFTGERSDQRIARFLGYAGLTSSAWNLDAGVATMSDQPVAGQSVVSLCQACSTTEGGGAALYVGTDGKVQFRSRTFRKPVAPALTFDAAADLDGSSFQPAYDDTQIVNQVQATWGAGASGSTLTANDAASQAAYGLTSSSLTSYATTDGDVLRNAQDQVAAQRTPAYHIPQVPVDLVTATTAGLYASVAAAAVGTRARITNLPPTAAPVSQVDQYIEGWSDTFSSTGWTTTFDTSPADTPAWMLWDDTTYGRWQTDGQTLSAGITAAATSLSIATTAGKPTFTTNAAMYPLTIKVGEEIIRLNSGPGGATSPQSFTGVTRGLNGTTAAAQSSGATVDLYPTATWTL